jgi:hypothetical protein
MRPAALHFQPTESSETIAHLEAGDDFALIEITLGWAWGYAGPDGRVGYVEAQAIARA